MSDYKTFVKIKPAPEKGYVDINYQFVTYYHTNEDGNMSCYIPGFDIYFSASDRASMDNKSVSITQMYINHFIGHVGKKDNLKAFVLQLHKLGFKANNDAMTVKSLINNKIVPSNFKAAEDKIPLEFLNASKTTHHSEMEVAM